MFFEMRQSNNYSYKRHCMILQYEILAIGLKAQLTGNAAAPEGSEDGRKSQDENKS